MAKTGVLGGFDLPGDDKDGIILEEVQRNARVSFADLGRRAGLSPPAAAERLRRLEDAGAIRGYHASVAPGRLGLGLTVLIEMRVPRAQYERFQRAVARLPWVLECHHVSGAAAFMLKAAVPDVTGLELLVGHLSQFGDTATSLVMSTVVERREFRREPRTSPAR
jgi:Lrp/AsnC family leucine-responsive transcriptional regulator